MKAGCALALLASLAAPSTAGAQGCPIPAGASPRLASVDPTARLAFLHDTLDQQALYADIWTWGWSAFGVGSAWGNFILADRATSDERIDFILAGSFSLLIPISVQVANLQVRRDAPVLDALMAGTDGGRAGTCLVLARAEELVARGAHDEDLHSAFYVHLLSIGVNGVLFGILAGLGHWGNAVLDLVGGIAISEAQILTLPTGASRGYKHYRAATFDVPKTSAWTFGPVNVRGGSGLGITASF